MNVSLNWLKDYIDTKKTASEIASLFTKHSQEVAGVQPLYSATNIKIGTVKNVGKISPEVKNQKCLVEVDGKIRQMVCGAPNVKEGQTVLVADIGAKLPGGLTIQKAVINGIESEGMICSLTELGIDKKYVAYEGIHELNLEKDHPLDLNDEVIELELTPNRMDLMSILGVAYDLSAMTKEPLIHKEVTLQESSKENPFKIEIATSKCDYYAGRVIENVTIKESPDWLKNRLIAAGIRPINNIVDVTNYIMIDLGQPLHAFDADLLQSNQIVVKEAIEKETFVTLDQQKRVLKKGDVLITNGEKAVALGGVMGGLDTEVTSKTTTVFLESACFNQVQIGLTSRRLDLRSESSLRFERGIAHDRTKHALNKAASMMAILSGGTLLKGVSEAGKPNDQPWPLSLSYDRVNRLLGKPLSKETIQDCMDALNINYKKLDAGLELEIPVRRLDLKTEQDMTEEIGRLIGYDQLESSLPKTLTEGGLSVPQKLRRKIKNQLQGLGLSEVITYSLSRPDKEAPFITAKNPVHVLRPLSEENIALKQTTVAGLLEVLKYHKSRQMADLKIYEWRHLYKDKEISALGMAFMGRIDDPLFKASTPIDFYYAKGVVTHVLDTLGIQARFEPLNQAGFHPYQSATILVNDKVIGYGGKIHPDMTHAYDLDEAFVFELDMDLCLELSRLEVSYQPIVKMPSVKRDLALITDKDMPSQTLIDAIFKSQIPYLEDVYVFDIYEGTPLKETEKSIALRIWFKPTEGTFKTEEIDEMMSQITTRLKQELGLELRA